MRSTIFSRKLFLSLNVLTDLCEDTKIVVEAGGTEQQSPGAYAKRLLRVLRDAAGENEQLILEVRT